MVDIRSYVGSPRVCRTICEAKDEGRTEGAEFARAGVNARPSNTGTVFQFCNSTIRPPDPPELSCPGRMTETPRADGSDGTYGRGMVVDQGGGRGACARGGATGDPLRRMMPMRAPTPLVAKSLLPWAPPTVGPSCGEASKMSDDALALRDGRISKSLMSATC